MPRPNSKHTRNGWDSFFHFWLGLNCLPDTCDIHNNTYFSGGSLGFVILGAECFNGVFRYHYVIFFPAVTENIVFPQNCKAYKIRGAKASMLLNYVTTYLSTSEVIVSQHVISIFVHFDVSKGVGCELWTWSNHIGGTWRSHVRRTERMSKNNPTQKSEFPYGYHRTCQGSNSQMQINSSIQSPWSWTIALLLAKSKAGSIQCSWNNTIGNNQRYCNFLFVSRLFDKIKK